MLTVDLSNIPSPCHLIDIDKVISNIRVITRLCQMTDMTLLFAIKGFSNDKIIRCFIEYFDGISASSLWEAQLGKEVLNSEVHTFSAAYTESNIGMICDYSDYMIFNSITHFQKFKRIAQSKKCHCGLRINPEFSEIENDAINPCHYASRFGVHAYDLKNVDFKEVEGLHFHNMSAQYEETFLHTVNRIEQDFGEYLYDVEWLNIGGGQFFSDEAYNLEKAVDILNHLQNKYSLRIIAEPCETIMLNTGYFVTTVTDIVNNGLSTAVLDSSAICHHPDIVYLPYRSRIQNADLPNKRKYTYRLAGATCYAGDIFGDYSFEYPLEIGTKIVFCDTAPYSMVKSNLFNGIQLPYYATIHNGTVVNIEKTYDFRTFLSMI